jgi:hemerythrin
MAFLEWRSEFSVGVVEFDMQHRQLIGIINRLHDAMSQGAPAPTLGLLLRELVYYTKFHFQREELALRSAHYPAYRAHCLEHEKLADQVFEFAEQFDQGRVTLSIELMSFLKNWLANHILGADQAYSRHLSGGLSLSGSRSSAPIPHR